MRVVSEPERSFCETGVYTVTGRMVVCCLTLAVVERGRVFCVSRDVLVFSRIGVRSFHLLVFWVCVGQ